MDLHQFVQFSLLFIIQLSFTVSCQQFAQLCFLFRWQPQFGQGCHLFIGGQFDRNFLNR